MIQKFINYYVKTAVIIKNEQIIKGKFKEMLIESNPEKFFRLHAQIAEEVPFRVDLIDFDAEIDFFNMLSSVGEVIRLG